MEPEFSSRFDSANSNAQSPDPGYGLGELVRQFRTGIPRERLSRLAEQTPVTTVVTLSVVFLVLAVVVSQVPAPWLYVWAAVQTALILAVFLRWRNARRHPARGPENRQLTRTGLHQAILWAALSGGLWGSLTAFLPGAPQHVQIALILTMGGMAAGATATLAAVPQAAIVFILLCGTPVTAYHLALGDQEGYFLGLVFAVFTAAMIGTSQVVSYALARQLRAEATARQLQEADELRKMAEAAGAALRESEGRLMDAIESISEGFILYDAADRFVLCNSRYRDFYPSIAGRLEPGATFGDLTRAALQAGAIRGSTENFDAWMERCVLQHRTARGTLYEQQLADGRWVLCSERRTSTGGTVGIRTDVTQLKRTEERFRQAQKMEAVGQLTGGVAHDFNNLLAVIHGNAELLADEMDHEDELLATILRASRRGAELTQRLLAFSRKQPLRPQLVDLGELIAAISGMLSRTLGETITVESRTEPGLWAALVDPGQVENAVLNLAINARDAMPGGGTLTIRCSNATLDQSDLPDGAEIAPGDYVVLAVSDIGTGMPKHVLEHAFEPFFTTKEVGAGSGLGLSMVYGFAIQSGGHATIASAPGQGTTVSLYLPRNRQPLTAKRVAQDDTKHRGQGETILVIEDDPDVRALAIGMLEGLGYQVLGAQDAASARSVLARGGKIDLILSDMVLPGELNGPDFAAEVRAAIPGMRFIFMSGYPAASDLRAGSLGEGALFLQKPFQKSQLTAAVRQALDR